MLGFGCWMWHDVAGSFASQWLRVTHKTRNVQITHPTKSSNGVRVCLWKVWKDFQHAWGREEGYHRTRTRISSQVQDQSGYRCPGRPSGVQSPSAKKTTNVVIQFAFLSFQSGPKLKQRSLHSYFCSERPTRRMSSTTWRILATVMDRFSMWKLFMAPSVCHDSTNWFSRQHQKFHLRSNVLMICIDFRCIWRRSTITGKAAPSSVATVAPNMLDLMLQRMYSQF